MARTQRTPQRSLRHGTAAREQGLVAPQNMPAVGRYGLRSANEKGGRATGELVRCTTGAAACGVGLASPACCWKRSTMADVKMRDSSCVRRELGFAAPDGWVPLAAGTRRGLTCRMGGSR